MGGDSYPSTGVLTDVYYIHRRPCCRTGKRFLNYPDYILTTIDVKGLLGVKFGFSFVLFTCNTKMIMSYIAKVEMS